ncbi:hypothetical protein BV22DRAFT_1035091 [Leucogyrophana mollusca]|uniref:Uncharacterized protein n=1 Tax=Leucogyrophana mollusca TaxID=85980 RepID=A0ACB8BG87_9AGAM|nr:hypothetical protein BV22DRAFT_1035091 [Leucogyrophana mollusca]
MPMDILFEIFGHLRPIDLLHLARTTKEFRRVLLHRSAMSVWRSARENVPGLPDCPSFMSEPHFANLAFDTHCHECLSPHIRSVDWRIGRRICMKCAKVCMIEEYPGTDPLYALVPSKYSKRGRPSYYAKEVSLVQNHLATLTTPADREAYIKERGEYVKELGKYASLLETWARTQARDRSDQLDEARRDRKEAIIEKLTTLGWGYEIEQIPYRDDLSHHKLVKQPTRLTERIWKNIKDEMVKYMEQMKTQRLDRERKALIIARKKAAVSVLRAYKLAHLPLPDIMPEPVDFCSFPEVTAIVELPTEYTVTQSTFDPVAEKLDEIIENWRARIHAQLIVKVREYIKKDDVAISEEDHNYDDEGNLLSRSKGKGKAVLPPSLSDEQIAQDIRLATTVFKCKDCTPGSGLDFPMFDYLSDSDDEDEMLGLGHGLYAALRRRLIDKSTALFYPKVMGHRCLTKQRGFRWEITTPDPISILDYPMGSRTKWSCKSLRVDEKAGKVVKELILACGLDPLTTTATQMDELDPRFACGRHECLDWSEGEGDIAAANVYDWRSAVRHQCVEHFNLEVNGEWERLVGDLLADAKKSEEYAETIIAGSNFIIPSNSVVWVCAHCLDLPQEKYAMDLARVKSHLSSMHSIEDPQENRDYFREYEAPQSQTGHSATRVTVPLHRVRPPGVPVPTYTSYISDDGEGEYDCYDFY